MIHRIALVVLVIGVRSALADGVAVYVDGPRAGASTIHRCEIDGERVTGALITDGEERDLSGLVRWGEPAPIEPQIAVVLADGSRLLCDRPWSPAGLTRVDETTVRLRQGKSWVSFPRDAVRWVLLAPETAGLDCGSLPAEEVLQDDAVYLRDGDQLRGQVEALTSDALRLVVAGTPIDTPLEDIAAVRLRGKLEKPGGAACLVGVGDGSLLRAERLVVANETFTATVAGAEVTGDAARLALVQPLASGVRYLSDLEPVDYRHTPYLDLPWPYARDEGLRGGPLVGGGRRAAKGLAMHTAARLVYRLDGEPARFQAEIAVADPEPESSADGSVVFRVYLVRDGKFEPAFDSGVVRVGDAAGPIDLDLAGAAAVALVVDFADDGDAGDDALWLDARLTGAQQSGVGHASPARGD